MASFIYKNHLINVFTNLNKATGFWNLMVVISWHIHSDKGEQILIGPADTFKLLRESEERGVEMGKAWVDQRFKL